MNKFLKILHLLSFDVVLGAVLCNIMFWKLTKSTHQHSFAVVFILGFSVWIIYILDRLLDNKKTKSPPTERHIFHQQNAKFLWYFIGFLAIICCILLFYLPAKIIIFGAIISSLTALYLLIISKISLQNNFQHFKEPVTSIVYTSAVFGTTILHDFKFPSLYLGIIFLLIVFQNLLLFSLLEFKKYIHSHNLAKYLGIKKSKVIIVSITLIILISSLYFINFSVSNYRNNVFFVEVMMSFVLFLINQFDNFFLTNDRYRWVGDGIFLLPLLIIL